MADEAVKIHIANLRRIDRLELERQLDPQQLSFENEGKDTDLHGELAIATAIVIVSLAALRVLSIHLARKRNVAMSDNLL
jgi:hypothetical protein